MKNNNKSCFQYSGISNFTLRINIPIIFLYFIAISYYYFAFFIAESSCHVDNILKFNHFMTDIFIGIKNKANIGEKLYHNGVYTSYILGIGLIIGLFLSLSFVDISTYPNLISKKIILQLEHEKDRRTKRRR